MTVTANIARWNYTGNGLLDTYPFTAEIYAKTDLKVYVDDVLQTVDGDYTIAVDSIEVPAGGNVVFDVGSIPELDSTISIVLDLPLTQLVDYVEGDKFPAEVHERALDRLIKIAQSFSETLKHTPKLPTSSLLDLDMPLPSPNDYIGWNAAADNLENKALPVATTATQYEVDALISYGSGTSYTKATIDATLTAVGTVNPVTVLLRPGAWNIDAAADYSAYSNVMFRTPQGSYFDIDDLATLTLYSPDNIIAAPTQQIFSDGNTNHDGVAFTAGGRMSTGWWGVGDGDSITNAWNSVLAAIWSISGTQKSSEVVIPPGDYTMDDYTGAGKQKIDDASGIWIHGYGARITYDDASSGDIFLEIEDSDHIMVEGLYADGNVANVGNGGGPLVGVYSSDYVKFLNCSFLNASKEGILVSDTGATLVPSKYGTIENCDLSGCARNGLALTGAQYWTLKNVKIHDAGQTNGTNPKAGIDLEPNAADLIGIEIINPDIQNAALAGIVYTNDGTYDGYNINIRGGKIAKDLDTASTYSIHTGTDAHGIIVDGTTIIGEVYAEGQIDILNSKLVSDATVTAAGHSCIRYLNTVYDHVRLINNRFEISGAYAKKLITVDARNAATRPWTMTVEANEFLTNGDLISSADVIAWGTQRTDDIVIFRANRFRHTGTAPGSPYYVDLNYNQDPHIFMEGNVFGTNLRLTGATGWSHRLNNINSVMSKHTTLTASGDASVTWSSAIPAGSVLLSTRIELVGALTLGGGGAVWRFGDTDADRFGETGTVADGTVLKLSDWTADANAPIFTTATDLIWAPDAGTLTGEADVEIIYISSPVF